MAFPVRTKPAPEGCSGSDDFLLFFDPGRDDVLFLDHLVHQIFGRVDERRVGVMVSLDVLALSTWDVFELASGDSIFDPLVGKCSKALDGGWHEARTRCEALF